MKLTKLTDEQLQNPEEWNFESAEVVEEKPKPSRSIVSVPFSNSDFQLVATRARLEGKKTATFIREAALDRARKPAQVTNLQMTGTSQGTFRTSIYEGGFTVGPLQIDSKVAEFNKTT